MAALVKRVLRPGERIRVLVVDDSVVIRRLVTHALENDPLIEIVGSASNGTIALQRIMQLKPDVVTLDIEMPEMDGLQMLRSLRRENLQVRVIMFSTLTARGASITLEALSLGADDYVNKVSNEGSLDRSLARLRNELVPKIHQFFHASSGAAGAVSPRPSLLPAVNITAPARPAPPRAAPPAAGYAPKVVTIGVSTGGPAALQSILPSVPASFPLPILVVQHMPPLFTKLLAERLHATCRVPVEEVAHGTPVQPGKILIAPGDFHMKLASRGKTVDINLDQAPPLNSCRPAVDALFDSAAEIYGRDVLAVVLTGMGQDGMRGAHTLKSRGARVLAQDEVTSVVWGMPGAVVNAGLADRILPLDQIVPEVIRSTVRN